MATGDALHAVAMQGDEIVTVLAPPDRILFRQFLRDALHEGDRSGPAGDRLVQFLIDRLPADHPVRVAALADRADLAAPADVGDVLEQLRSLLASLDAAPSAAVVEVEVRARRRALAWPMHPGGDGGEPGLIRLIDDDGVARLPAFQFGRDARPLRIVQTINDILLADHDPWGVAFWWLTANAWLGEAPARVLGRAPDADLVAAAQAVRGG